MRVDNFVKHNDSKKTTSGNDNDCIDGTLTLPSPSLANKFTDNDDGLPEVDWRKRRNQQYK